MTERWEFTASIEYHDFGRMGYTVVYLPEPWLNREPFASHPRLRVHAEVAEIPVDGAFQPGQGKRYLIVSKAVLKSASVQCGDEVNVMFRLADPEHVDVPEALRSALSRDATARAAFEVLTAGKQRALVHRVNDCKTLETQRKRVREVLDVLRQG